METINQWYARIKSKAVTCSFGSQLEDEIKDIFVTDLKIGPVLDRVCEEVHTRALAEVWEVAASELS